MLLSLCRHSWPQRAKPAGAVEAGCDCRLNDTTGTFAYRFLRRGLQGGKRFFQEDLENTAERSGILTSYFWVFPQSEWGEPAAHSAM